MIALIVFIILIITVAFIYFNKHKAYSDEIEEIDKKTFPLKTMLIIGLAIIDMTAYKFKAKYNEKQRIKLAELYGDAKVNQYMRIYMANNICLSLLIAVIILFFGSMLWVQENLQSNNTQANNLKGNTLQRPAFGNGDKTVVVNAEISKGNIVESFQYSILLKELPPANDAQAVKRVYEMLDEKLIKGKNNDINSITDSLVLKNTYDLFKRWDIKIYWISSDNSVLKEDGSIQPPPKGQASKPITLTAVISRNKAKLSKTFDVIVKSQEQSEEEKQIFSAKNQIDSIVKKTADADENEKVVNLPGELEDYEGLSINWTDADQASKSTEDTSGVSYLVLALFVGAAVVFIQQQEITNRVAVRHKQIRYEFPVFLTKLLLLINAGMTMHNAWEKIAVENNKDTPLYREIDTTITEIKGGMPEYQAYERFAQRCRMPEVSKFVSIIIQNLRKGNSELVQLLKLQSRECWEIRKNSAKKAGEEASTKLLLPMVLMLLGILIIVSTPALLAINSF